MKKIMLAACGILIALTSGKLFAQEINDHAKKELKDTLVIKLRGADKIFIISEETLKDMSKYNKGDSLKMLFITDWEKALEEHAVSPESKTVHYFVHPSGKRRLKAESGDYVEPAIDVDKEITRLDLDLPKYQYIIHDLNEELEIQIYLQDPNTLKDELGSISINEAFRSAATNKKELKRNYKIELSWKDGEYKLTDKRRNTIDMIEITPAFGIGMIGNQVSPAGGLDLYFSFTDKYRVPQIKVGLGGYTYAFAELKGADVISVNPVGSYDLKFMMNIENSRRKAKWVGFEGGILKSKNGGSLDNAWKAGIINEGFGPFNFGFDIIGDTNNHTLFSAKIILPF